MHPADEDIAGRLVQRLSPSQQSAQLEDGAPRTGSSIPIAARDSDIADSTIADNGISVQASFCWFAAPAQRRRRRSLHSESANGVGA